MILQYLTKAKLDELRLSLDSDDTIKRYEKQDKEWFQNYLNEGNGLIPYGKEIPDFSLNRDANYNVSDLENVKILYENLKELPLSVACDERFWAGLSHTEFFDYVWYRQGEEIKKAKDAKAKRDRIKGAYFRKVAGRRGIFVNCLSRLWWTGYLAYDEKRDNPYELVEPLMYGQAGHSYASQIMLISARNFTSNRDLFHGIMQAMLEFKRNGNEIKREVFEAVLTYFNNISAITVLDFLSEKDAYEIAMERLQVYKEMNSESTKEEPKETVEEAEHEEPKIPKLAISTLKPAPAPKAKPKPGRKIAEEGNLFSNTYGEEKKPAYVGSFTAAPKRRKQRGKVTGSSTGKGPITRTLVVEDRKKKK